MKEFYKAVRPDGTDFYTGMVRWAPEVGEPLGHVVAHPTSRRMYYGSASSYLSVSVEPADCTGMRWPCRLLLVEPVYGWEVTKPDNRNLPNKRASLRWRVVQELDSTPALGPNGLEVAAYLETLKDVPPSGWDAARGVARDAAWDAAGRAAWYTAGYTARHAARDAAGHAAWDAAGHAARDAAGHAAGYAAGYAAEALIVRDIISTDSFATLTAPMRAAGIDFDSLGEVNRGH